LSTLREEAPVTDFSAEVVRAAELFDLTYRGTAVLFLGGPLDGEVRLGTTGMWRTADGLEIFRCGDNPTLQAAIVASADGRVGGSVAGEFTPLFDTVDLLIANAAAWERVRDWRYVAAGDMPVVAVLDPLDGMTVDASASGELTTWWISPDLVVTAQRWLNSERGPNPDVSVLARTESAFEEARRRLARTAGVEPYVFTAADIRGTPAGRRTPRTSRG
jgi:hypothetical protein